MKLDSERCQFGDPTLARTVAPEISLVVSTLGRREKLDRLLTSLRAQTMRNFEIIVVDQNDPGYLDAVMLRHQGDQRLRHVRSPKGVSLGRNVGAETATAPIVGFPDDDCWYDTDVLRKVMARFAASPQTAVVIGRTVDESGRNSIIPALPEDCTVTKEEVPLVGNANAVFVRRDVFQRIGQFDLRLGPGAATSFQSAEDMDLVARLVASDFRSDYFTDLIIRHEQVETGNNRAYLERVRKYSLGTGAFYRKNGYGFATVALLVLKAIGGIPLRLLRRQPLEIRPKLTYALSLASGYFLWRENDEALIPGPPTQ
ncbi:glycosyltransferase family A protein [Sinorhizobium sp. BG8]|uniref:glycosyltransferase family 2 protein n=1 Tax=Sinorhizobium sp. BG8 TaxID=2613773 RepID=UPI00193D6985|nr:glycosyltransferase family A protein [Sinorhizobium sp. BG8]